MGPKQAEKIKNNLITEYGPFNHFNNDRVLVHYIANGMEMEDIYRDERIPLCFELIREKQVFDRISPEVVDPDKTVLFSYTFNTFIKENQLYHMLKEDEASELYFWAHLLNPNDPRISQYNCSYPGIAVLSYKTPEKYRDEDILPSTIEVTLCWNEEMSSADSQLAEKYKGTIDYSKHVFDGTNIVPEEELEKKWFVDKTEITVKVFKVGSANATFIKYENGKTILLDCGIDSKHPDNYIKARQYIRNEIQPTALIISHWHPDHFRLITEINDKKLETVLYPETGLFPNYVQKAFDAWEARGIEVKAIKNDPKLKVTLRDYPDTTIFTGNGTSPSPIEKTRDFIGDVSRKQVLDYNECGLIVAINHNSRKFIMPADVSYYNWPQDNDLSLVDFERMILPHHSCQAFGKDINTKPPIINTNSKRYVYISNYNDTFQNWQNNFHRSFVDHYMKDTNGDGNRHLYTSRIPDECRPYYLFSI